MRQRTRRSMQQLHLAGFLAKNSCTVAGIGDTRLGDDITSFTTPVKHAAHAEHASAVEATEDGTARTPGRPVTSSWYSSGSSADRNGAWRGGVALGSYGEAQQRMYGHIIDCRGWGRYRGAIYQGREGGKLVVVQAYFPHSEYVKTENDAATTRTSSAHWRRRRHQERRVVDGSQARYHQSRHTHSCGTQNGCLWMMSQCIWRIMQTTKGALLSSWVTSTQI